MKLALLLTLSGILSTYLWVSLFGFWAVYDTPLLKIGYSIGLSVPLVRLISQSLFSFLTAALFIVPLRLFCRDSFPGAAMIFIATFLLAFLASAFIGGEVASLLTFFALWQFILLFAACAVLVTRYHHANESMNTGAAR